MSKPNPIALITGGSRGLGRSMALHLADRGVDVILTYVAKEADAAAVVKAIEGKGRKAVALRLDVGKSDTFAAFAQTVKATLQKTYQREQLNTLVNNAGTGMHAAFADTTEEQFDDMFRVHLKSTFFVTQKLLPLIADGGHVLNVSSGLSRIIMPGASAYGTMKGGVEVLTRYMARELASRKIAVNVIAPGAIATDFNGARVRDNPELNKIIAAATAMGRVGQADDIGAAVAAILSPDMGWVTGQRIEASGGQAM